LLALAMLATIWVASPVAFAADRVRGRPLGDVLRELRASGLTLMYSSAVVDEDRPVPIEPTTRAPAARLAEILAAVGLRSEPGPGRVLLIVPDDSAAEDGEEARRRALRLGAALGYRAEVRVVPGERGVDDGTASPTRGLERRDLLPVPAIGGDVGRIVEKLPGVVSADNSAAWSVRGSLPGDTSLVVDGLELYDPYHLREFQSPFTLVDPDVIDRIDVLPGGFTVEYGDRHGAFVEIETANQIDRGAGGFELGTLNSRVALRAPLADGTGAWLVSGRGWYPEAVVDSLGLGGGERLRPRMGDLFAKWTRVRPDGTVWAAHALLSYDRIRFQESGEDDNERVDAESRHANVWIRARRLWTARLRTETVLSGGAIRGIRDGVASPEEDLFTVRDRRELTYLGASHELVWAPRTGRRFKLGAEVRHLDGSYRYDLRAAGAATPDRAANLDPRGWQYGIYAAHRRRLATGLAGEVGVRWDRQEVSGDEGLSPRAHLVWMPSDRTEMRLAVGRYRQSQRVHELSIADGETTYAPAEVSEQIEWMVRRRSGGGHTLRLDLYHRRLDRLRTRYENLFSLVELFPEASDDRVAITPSHARLQGLELTLRGPDARPWRWWAAYALTSAKDRVDGRDVPRILDQRHTAKFLVAWTARPRWTLALSGTAHTGRPFTTVTAEEVLDPGGEPDIEVSVGPRNAERLPDYLRLDLKVAHRVPVRRGTLSWTVDVLNVTDRRNACCVADFLFRPTGGGTVDVRTEFEAWLGIVPTFSVGWEY
jgi:outer membrane receptor protein involved in Fe transport